jgi:hypothetical protein
LLSLPAVGSAFRATVGGLVKVFDGLPDADDDHQRNLIKAPIRVAVQFAVRVRVAGAEPKTANILRVITHI